MSRFDWLALLAGGAIGLGALETGPGAAAQDRGEAVELGGLTSRVPAGWAGERPDDPRYHRQYRLGPVGNDKEDARLTVEPLGTGRARLWAVTVRRNRLCSGPLLAHRSIRSARAGRRRAG